MLASQSFCFHRHLNRTWGYPAAVSLLNTPTEDQDLVFYMWGHGYELDFGTKRGNYEHLEHLFQMISKVPDVVCVTNRELFV